MSIVDSPSDVLRLRRAVEKCLSLLGTGILLHPPNAELRKRLEDGELDERNLGQQLQIRLLQIIAWCLGERLGVVPDVAASKDAVIQYERFHSCQSHWRDSVSRGTGGSGERWARVRRVLFALRQGDAAIAIKPWRSELFDPKSTDDIDGVSLGDPDTQALLSTVATDIVEPPRNGATGSADVQVLGRVHEWLLQLQLVFNRKDESITFETVPGHRRRATGSYFTPNDLVEDLLDRVLLPLLDERVAGKAGDDACVAILSLRVVDPACGTGIFLLAAARRIASQLARYRRDTADYRGDSKAEMGQVITRCLHGVDIGETTVHLCRLALWFETGPPFSDCPDLEKHILCGNSIFGAWPGTLEQGIPDIAFTPGPSDDTQVARALRRRNRQERTQLANSMAPMRHSTRTADLWCASFVWPKVEADWVPTCATLADISGNQRKLPSVMQRTLDELCQKYRFFHWHQRFAGIFGDTSNTLAHSTATGFDVVIGNPPWVAHAGRSTQVLSHGVKNSMIHCYSSFGGFPTTHGVFVEMATRIVAEGGRIGLIVPASVADLDGYASTRAAHDARCELVTSLPDYGEGRFTGVTQPCIAVVSRCTGVGAVTERRGRPWPLERSDLDAAGYSLLERWEKLEPFPGEIFGERGFQSTPQLRAHVCRSSGPQGRFTLPLREGSNVREFELGESRLYADPNALSGVLRSNSEFAQVALVVRQTARYPIAARSDGRAFRNSLLAVLPHEDWHWALMLCVLNSSLVRWIHFHRYRDGRQPILPQLKVGHLRSLAMPPTRDASTLNSLVELGVELSSRNHGIRESERSQLDQWVMHLYALNASECSLVTGWHSGRPR